MTGPSPKTDRSLIQRVIVALIFIPILLGLFWVGDLALRCTVAAESERGQLLLELRKGGRRFRCRFRAIIREDAGYSRHRQDADQHYQHHQHVSQFPISYRFHIRPLSLYLSFFILLYLV